MSTTAARRARLRQSREETRRQILDSAAALLETAPFRELGIDAVMSGTGHSRTVFYRHFDDLPSLVLALMAERGAELVALGEAWAGVDETGPEVAHERLAKFVDFYVRNGRLVRAVTEASHHDEAVQQAYEGFVETFVDVTAAAIQARLDAGELTGAVDPPEMARALVWMLNGYLNDRLGGTAQADPERVLETVTTVWSRTLFGS